MEPSEEGVVLEQLRRHRLRHRLTQRRLLAQRATEPSKPNPYILADETRLPCLGGSDMQAHRTSVVERASQPRILARPLEGAGRAGVYGEGLSAGDERADASTNAFHSCSSSSPTPGTLTSPGRPKERHRQATAWQVVRDACMLINGEV